MAPRWCTVSVPGARLLDSIAAGRDGTTVRLKRGVLPEFGEGGIQSVQLQGRLLEPQRDLLLYEEEVPREGARVTRTYQYARWTDGPPISGSAAAKNQAAAGLSSGLQFDVAEVSNG